MARELVARELVARYGLMFNCGDRPADTPVDKHGDCLVEVMTLSAVGKELKGTEKVDFAAFTTLGSSG